jgi:hypothetical protein
MVFMEEDITPCVGNDINDKIAGTTEAAMYLEIIYAVIYSWIILVSLWAGFRVRQFLQQTPTIENEMSLERYKAIARRNMYLALFQLPVFVAGFIIGILLLVFHGYIALVFVLLANGVVFLLGKYLGTYEKKARSLPCASPDLQEQHRIISEIWVKKALPDF